MQTTTSTRLQRSQSIPLLPILISSPNLSPTRSPDLPSSISPLLPLSSTKKNKNQQVQNEIEELCAVQRQQEHTILSVNDTLNDLLSFVESLTSEISSLKVLSWAESEKGDKYNLDYNAKWAEQKPRLAKNTLPVPLEVFRERYNTNRIELLDMLQQKLKSRRSLNSIRKDEIRSTHFDERNYKNTCKTE
ncbi:20113_t:CDS:2, partial [Racocetra fulgida]